MEPRVSRMMAALAVVLVLSCACGSTQGAQYSTGGTATGRGAFVRGLDDFCRAFYEGQRRTDERYPNTRFARQYAAGMVSQARRADALLDGLHPLPAVAPAFAQFVENEGVIYRSLAAANARAAGGGDAAAGPAYEDGLNRRHELARSLGARQCDGVLPQPQSRAAVAALRRWDVTRDWRQACVGLVTKEYAPTQWMHAADPTAACREAFAVRHSGAFPEPQQITVSSVTGVENLSATVHFAEVPDCGCGDLVGRLYYEGHRWLVRNAYVE